MLYKTVCIIFSEPMGGVCSVKSQSGFGGSTDENTKNAKNGPEMFRGPFRAVGILSLKLVYHYCWKHQGQNVLK